MGIVKMLIDDVFNTVVVARFVFILFGLSSVSRFLARLLGMGGIMNRHAAWFYEQTGFKQGEDTAMYMSERLFSLTAGLGLNKIGEVSVGAIMHVDALSTSWELLWRLLVPIVMYVAYARWQAL